MGERGTEKKTQGNVLEKHALKDGWRKEVIIKELEQVVYECWNDPKEHSTVTYFKMNFISILWIECPCFSNSHWNRCVTGLVMKKAMVKKNVPKSPGKYFDFTCSVGKEHRGHSRTPYGRTRSQASTSHYFWCHLIQVRIPPNLQNFPFSFSQWDFHPSLIFQVLWGLWFSISLPNSWASQCL